MLMLAVLLVVVAVVLIGLGWAGFVASWLLYLGLFLAVIAVVLLVVPAIGTRRNRQL